MHPPKQFFVHEYSIRIEDISSRLDRSLTSLFYMPGIACKYEKTSTKR